MAGGMLVKDYQNSIGKFWYRRLALAAILILIAYGCASWAIDNGNLVLYGITIVLVYFAIGNVYKAGRLIFSKNDR